MNVYVNELAFHGQFHTVARLLDGLKGLWRMHELCTRYGTRLYCSRSSPVTRPGVAGLTVGDAVLRHASPEDKRMFRTWLDKTGPFWDDNRIHDPDTYYYLLQNGRPEELVTDTGLSECTAFCLEGGAGAMASVTPSDFEYTPIITELEADHDPRIRCPLQNFWQSLPLESILKNTVRLATWEDLAEHASAVFTNLLFTDQTFEPLANQPFSRAVANCVLDRLRVLDNVSAAFQPDGSLNAEGQKLTKTYFTGHDARFTDSSVSDMNDFEKKMTFTHPLTGATTVFPWHGKIRLDRQYRIHFEWPKAEPRKPLPVVYVGPKLTKR